VAPSSEKHQKTEAPDKYSLTPLLGHRHLRGDVEAFTSHLEEAFIRTTDQFPEEAFFFLNIKHVRERVRFLRKRFFSPEEGGCVAYAVKANPRKKILRILDEEKIRSYDCASRGEIDIVLSKINGQAEILFNHPIKRSRDIQAATKKGVRHFSAQTLREVEKILINTESADPDELEIEARLDTPTPHQGINLSEKFGATEETVREMIREIKLHGAQPGISIHTGSQNSDPHIFIAGISKMLQIAREEGGVRTINVGGGLPVNIHEHDQFDLEVYLDAITSTIRKSIHGVFLGEPKIIIEPGRAMVAESVDLLIPVLSVEPRRGEQVIYIDDGIFTSFSDRVIHHWKYHFKAWRKTSTPLSSQTIPYRVFGRSCDSGDSLGLIELPKNLKEGDYLHVPTAGAYMDSQSSEFNGFKPPRYVYYNI